ncbi:MAG: insulinase family protein, partial [Candidatus Eisenbacteria bacterium]|nr:insulinase family protein [Candidatus Eisenbacteria bacterium]
MAPVVALSTWVPVGAADDPEQLSGLSHFLEHMLFRDEAGVGAGLTLAVQRAGGYLNASTGYDHTTFYQIVPSESWQSIFEAQAKVLGAPSFRVGDIESERAVIQDELSLAEGDPSVLCWRHLMKGAFEGSPYGRPVAGTSDALARIGLSELVGHYREHYRPDQKVCVIVGDVDADDVIDKAGRILAPDRRGAAARAVAASRAR